MRIGILWTRKDWCKCGYITVPIEYDYDSEQTEKRIQICSVNLVACAYEGVMNRTDAAINIAMIRGIME